MTTISLILIIFFGLVDRFNAKMLFAVWPTLMFASFIFSSREPHEWLQGFGLIDLLGQAAEQIGARELTAEVLFADGKDDETPRLQIASLRKHPDIPLYFRLKSNLHDTRTAVQSLENNYVFTLIAQAFTAGVAVVSSRGAAKFELDCADLVLGTGFALFFIFRYWWPVYDRRQMNDQLLVEEASIATGR
jgi:hypothetical protein